MFANGFGKSVRSYTRTVDIMLAQRSGRDQDNVLIICCSFESAVSTPSIKRSYSRDDLSSGGLRWSALPPPEWRGADKEALAELTSTELTNPTRRNTFGKITV